MHFSFLKITNHFLLKMERRNIILEILARLIE